MIEQLYSLPSNGPYRPELPSQAAARSGPFYAELTDHGADAWMGEHREPMTWPEGWRVGFEPTRLIDPDGNVLAHEGEPIRGRGGLDHEGQFAVSTIRRWQH